MINITEIKILFYFEAIIDRKRKWAKEQKEIINDYKYF